MFTLPGLGKGSLGKVGKNGLKELFEGRREKSGGDGKGVGGGVKEVKEIGLLWAFGGKGEKTVGDDHDRYLKKTLAGEFMEGDVRRGVLAPVMSSGGAEEGGKIDYREACVSRKGSLYHDERGGTVWFQ